ncbi:MAG: segregation/condensation protein A [Eubacterium sp.]|nr:segregation/condensation protein A [Eubacterium sp.]
MFREDSGFTQFISGCLTALSLLFYILTRRDDLNSIPVKLDAFEGPLDLLLHLIEKNKVDIYDIPIAMITDQYIEYIKAMQDDHLDVMTDFLVMAATLLRIKSAMLLPKDEEAEEEGEEDPRLELTKRLIEYKMYKYASMELKDMALDASKRLYKSENIPEEVAKYKEEVKAEDVIGDTTLDILNRLFKDIMKRYNNRLDPIRSSFGRINKEEVNFTEKIVNIQKYGIKHKKCNFRKLIDNSSSKVEIIVTFLGILELIKMGRVSITQEDIYGDIEVEFLSDEIVAVEQYSI